MLYPIGIQSFPIIINEGYTYVDKTDLIYSLAKRGAVYFLSRPRRFGKSLLVSTLKAYFEGRKELFTGLKIEELEKEWRAHKVFVIDFNGTNFNDTGALENRLNDILTGYEQEYGIATLVPKDYDVRFMHIIKAAYEQTGKGVVVLVDEYDKPLLDLIEEDEQLLDVNRKILKAFYTVFKLANDYLGFVFLTGITKFSQVSVFSGFNQPRDISMNEDYEAICGITEDELHSVFSDSIATMAASASCTYAQMSHMLKQHYDGYHFSKRMTDIYNPFSIFNALADRDIQNYWFASGSPSYLIKLLDHTNTNIDDLINEYYSLDEFVNYKADAQYPVPMLYQSGYLTIKKYDTRTNLFLLDFPNNEVKTSFYVMLANDYLKSPIKLESWNLKAVVALDDGNIEQFIKMFRSLLASIPYSARRKDNERENERFFQVAFFLVLRSMSCYRVFSELQQSQGRVDCVVETPKYVYVFEFKLDQSSAKAMQQIEDKGYALPYEADPRKVIKVGINFSSKTGTIDDWLVQ